MAVFRTVIRSDLQKPLVVQQLSGNMFTADNASNEIAVEVTNGGEPVALSGAVTAYAVRADGVTAMFSGTISGNVASIVLPASCYVEVGTLSIVVKVGSTTVGACTCYVYRTTTDEIVDPGHVIPSIDELLEQIDACRTATTNANTAATNANTAASNANAKAALADEKATLADQKATLANTAAQNADTKASLADTAATNANTKAGLANDAATLANTKAALADEKANLADTKATLADTAATNANTKAELADTAAQNADAKATLANDAATLANTKAGLAETAATNANTAAGKIDNMTVAATGLPAGVAPVATITEVDGHKHIAFQIPKGDKGKDFHIAKTFSSISAMMAYAGTDLEKYDFAMIDTGSVEDPDTGKLYCYEPDKNPKWSYIGDLSGAQGIKGETGTGIDHVSLNADYTLTVYYDDGTSDTTTSIRGATGITPNIAIGTVATLQPGQQAYVALDPTSTPERPVMNFGIPKGDTGSASNIYGTTVPMSENDSTTVYDAIGEKLDKDQGTANAGKFMKVGADGELVPDTVPDPTNKADKVQNAVAGNFAGLDANGNLTDSGKKPSDFLTQHQDISGKLDKDQGSANSGKFMKVGADGKLVPDTVPDPTDKADKVQNATSGNFAGLDANGNLTDSGKKPSDFLTEHQDISGKVDKNQGAANAGKALGINSQGLVEPVPFSGNDFTGATATSPGTHGYVPAPAAGYQNKILRGDGTWATPESGKLFKTALDRVSNNGGPYVHATTVPDATSEMKAIVLEVSNPEAFLDRVRITVDNGAVTLSCDNVNGISEVTVSLMFEVSSNTMTSSEFDVLAGRITANSGRITENTERIADTETDITALNERIDNLDPEAPSALFSDLAFSLAVADWTLDSQTGLYNAVVNNTILLTANAGIQVFYDNSFRTALVGDIYVNKSTGYVTFTTTVQPVGTLTGFIRIMDSTTGIVPVHRGGTGAATPKQARANLNAPIRDIPVDFGTVTSLPQTVYDPDLRANMVAFDATFSNPAAIPNGIDVTFADPSGNLGGSVTITGTISGETTIKFWAHEERKVAEGSETAQETQRVQDFVQTNAQTLTPAQKTQVLENIGATEELDGLQEQVDEVNGNLENLPKKVVTVRSYYADYTYNTWVSHSVTFPTLTNIENAFIGAIIGASTAAPHEVEIIAINGNTVSYIGKGMWSGGASGITAVITAIGS